MIEASKLTSGIYDSTLLSLLNFNTQAITRGHNKKLTTWRCNKTIRSSFFTQRITTWNNLPNSVVNAPTLQTFESCLDKFWNETDVKYNFKSELGTGTNQSQSSQLDLNTVA